MNSLRENIRELLPKIAANAETAEREAMVPKENVALLREVGFFKALQPREYNGKELEFHEYAECLVDIAEACASTAWACGLLANHSHGIALFDKKLQQEIWGENPDVLVSSSVAPLGKWEKVDGGIELSGRFGWSSGCDHADWAVLGYLGKNDMGQPGPCFAVVPRSDYEILEDWDTSALRGTGSKTLVVEKAFVPDYRCESLFALNYGLSRGYGSNKGYIYCTPFSPIFSLGFAAVALGIGRRFIQLFTEKTKSRVRAYTGAKVVDTAAAQMRLAESVNQITAAQSLLRNDWKGINDRAATRELPSMDEVLDWRCHQSYAIKMTIEAVDRLFAASGGGAWFNSNEMQRLFRDVHITGAHAQTDFDIAAQTYGRHLLGLPMDSKHY